MTLSIVMYTKNAPPHVVQPSQSVCVCVCVSSSSIYVWDWKQVRSIPISTLRVTGADIFVSFSYFSPPCVVYTVLLLGVINRRRRPTSKVVIIAQSLSPNLLSSLVSVYGMGVPLE